ncbi:xanthine dehydrogenase accessory protein XdhC [Aliiglaciecola lipolytica]|uniref:Xanthine dehydrogenase accessory factor n=1 Tax=Aliiglaciecola lipolytica E3 TaxID=1127673 RepID=K6Y947_9ALTE|nr:xanthine dehydrogenase accessory protein XdhC [Aliiglaciecola lipolytica]GAC14727.1 xanthine dehydrogenase accessory factor [Aliiglaciecola lipolytica E3]
MIGNRWFDGIHHCQNTAKEYVVLTVMGSVGSTPRAQGTKMVVTEDRIFDTIGGGHLEHMSIQKARSLLADKKTNQHVEYFPLGAKLAQCCGGATHVLFEVFWQHANQLLIFGAGHVAQALIPIVSQLPVSTTWVDSRQHIFDDLAVPDNIHTVISQDCIDVFNDKQINYVLVMTHDHQLDYDIVKQALTIDSIQYLGLIGSETKAKRFKTRLKNHNISEHQLQKLICPVGLDSVTGKRPIEVAISIAGQLIQHLNSGDSADPQNTQTAWVQTKEIAKIL